KLSVFPQPILPDPWPNSHGRPDEFTDASLLHPPTNPLARAISLESQQGAAIQAPDCVRQALVPVHPGRWWQRIVNPLRPAFFLEGVQDCALRRGQRDDTPAQFASEREFPGLLVPVGDGPLTPPWGHASSLPQLRFTFQRAGGPKRPRWRPARSPGR